MLRTPVLNHPFCSPHRLDPSDRKQVITTFGPRKPQRQSSNANSSIASDIIIIDPTVDVGPPVPTLIATVAAAASHQQMPTNGVHIAAFASSTTSSSSPEATPSSSRLVTPNSARKIVCLETSFTSLQKHADQPSSLCSLPPTATSTHTTSRSATPRSIAKQPHQRGSKDSIHAPNSQLSSILQYDDTSLHDVASDTPPSQPAAYRHSHGAHTRLQATAKQPPAPVQSRPTNHHHHHHQRSVAFDASAAPRTHGPPTRKPLHSLAAHGKRSQSDLNRQRVDLVYDDWYGMAPLASPETLSEISSISSRTSLVNTVTSSIEKYLQRVSFYPGGVGGANGRCGDGHGVHDSDSESELTAVPEDTQLCTPRIMRRTPKIAGNLAGCADDWRSVDTYKRMGKVFVTGGQQPAAMDSNHSGIESSEQSFESANSMRFAGRSGDGCTGVGDATAGASRSVDRLDDGQPVELLMNAAKLTWSDGDILGDSCQAPRCPHCPCRYYRSGSDCCPQLEHAFCTRPMANGPAGRSARNAAAAAAAGRRFSSTVNSGSSDGTFYSAESSLQRLDVGGAASVTSVSSPPRRIHLEATAKLTNKVLESHFPCNVAEEDEDDEEEEDFEEEYEDGDGEERSSLLTPRSATSTNTGSAATILQQTDAATLAGSSTGASTRRQQLPITSTTTSVKVSRRKDFGVSTRWTDDDDDDSNNGGSGAIVAAGGCSASGARFTRNESSLPLLAKTLAASLNSRGLSSKRNRNVIYPVLSSYSRNSSPSHQRQTISSSSSSVASTKGGESSV